MSLKDEWVPLGGSFRVCDVCCMPFDMATGLCREDDIMDQVCSWECASAWEAEYCEWLDDLNRENNERKDE